MEGEACNPVTESDVKTLPLTEANLEAHWHRLEYGRSLLQQIQKRKRKRAAVASDRAENPVTSSDATTEVEVVDIQLTQ